MKPSLLLIHPALRSYRVDLFNRLHEAYKTHFVFLVPKERLDPFPEAKKWKCTSIHTKPRFGYATFSWDLFKTLWKERKHYDVVITSGLSQFNTHVGFLMAKLLKKKFMVFSEDWVWPKPFVFRLVYPYVKWIARRADACIAAGTKAREFYLKLGASPKKVFTSWSCALDLSQKEAVHGVNPEHKTVIAYLGRIVRYKGLDLLIQAFAELEKKRDDVMLLIVGDGPFAPKCRDLLDSLGVKNFHWPQYEALTASQAAEIVPHDEFIRYFALADLFVLPGRFIWTDHVPCESWGLTINEAMSLKKPVLTVRSVAAAFDLVDEGKTGFLVRENSDEALLKGMESFLDLEPEAQKQMGKNAGQKISTFTSEAAFEGYEEAINSLQIPKS